LFSALKRSQQSHRNRKRPHRSNLDRRPRRQDETASATRTTRHHCCRGLQRPSTAHPAPPRRRRPDHHQSWHCRQILRTRRSRRHRLHGNINHRRPPTRYRLPALPQPTQRRHQPRTMVLPPDPLPSTSMRGTNIPYWTRATRLVSWIAFTFNCESIKRCREEKCRARHLTRCSGTKGPY